MQCSNNQCKCRKNGLFCSEFCSYSEDEDPFANVVLSTEGNNDRDVSDNENI